MVNLAQMLSNNMHSMVVKKEECLVSRYTVMIISNDATNAS